METIQNITIEWPQTENPKQNGFSTIDDVITHKETALTIEHIVAYEVIKRLLENKSIVRLNYEIDGEVKELILK